MPMERASILAGNCYSDRTGAIYEVKAIIKDVVTFVAFPRAGALQSEGSLPIKEFAEKLEGQVPCPSPGY
jgi:hypothetical protein